MVIFLWSDLLAVSKDKPLPTCLQLHKRSKFVLDPSLSRKVDVVSRLLVFS